jgi:glycosidase
MIQLTKTIRHTRTNALPWKGIDPGYPATNVEVETSDPTSLLSHYRRLLAPRNRHPALRRSEMDLVSSSNPGVFASLRLSADEAILVILNLTASHVSECRLSASTSHLLPGRYSAESLMQPVSFNELGVGTNGTFAGFGIGPDIPVHGTLIIRLVPQ